MEHHNEALLASQIFEDVSWIRMSLQSNDLCPYKKIEHTETHRDGEIEAR